MQSAQIEINFFLKIMLGCILLCGLLFSGFSYLLNNNNFSCDALNSGKYIYKELGTGRLVIFDMLSGYLTNGHKTEKMFICSDEFYYQCVIGDSNGFVFAVPKKPFMYIMGNWDFNDLKFSLELEDEDTYILGTFVYKIKFIDKDKTENIWYYYSPWRGILAMGFVDEKGTNTNYIVQSTCGILSK